MDGGGGEKVGTGCGGAVGCGLGSVTGGVIGEHGLRVVVNVDTVVISEPHGGKVMGGL